MEAKLGQSEPQINFPFESKLSLTNLIVFWQVKAMDKDPYKSRRAKEVLAEVDKIEDFKKPITDYDLLEKNRSVLDLLMSGVFSPFADEEEIISAMVPFKMEAVHGSKGYWKLMEKAMKWGALQDQNRVDTMIRHKTMAAYAAIMDLFYNVTLDFKRDMIYTLDDPESRLQKFYRISINPKFCEIIPHGDLPELSDADIAELKDNLDNLDIWFEKLPPKHFEFQGMIIMMMTEVTKDEVLSRIKELLLETKSIGNDDTFGQLERLFRSLLQLPDLRLGIAGYNKDKGRFINFGNSVKRSILLGEEKDISCATTNQTLYEYFSEEQEPMIIEDASTCFKDFGGHAQNVINSGIKNFIMSPLSNGSDFVGLLELASPKIGDLDASAAHRILEVLPLFAIAVKRNTEEIENSIRAIIKHKYTSIHPALEWKFNEAAYQMYDQVLEGKNPSTPQIVFNDVYPLYAASDIRNSSLERSKAINKDLGKQLKLAKNVLEKAFELSSLPILDEIVFRLNKFLKRLKNKMVTGDEATILDFLQKEVEPLIRNFEKKFKSEIEGASQKYWSALDPDLGLVYESRRNFESSLTTINNEIANILDEDEQKAQRMFPHFFERYKTDGVEHNIYIGDSMVENMEFDQMYLKNMRLWQMVVTTEIANRTAALKNDLPLPLDTTHLILVHSNPLSVRFRLDEKKFDVDGAYNIRYEIVKKRIDKATVKGSNERITQPGKIAVIYSQEKDAQEYKTYFDFLKEKNLVLDDLETLELEDLQGVSGLKALRFSVNLGTNTLMDEVKKLLEIA